MKILLVLLITTFLGACAPQDSPVISGPQASKSPETSLVQPTSTQQFPKLPASLQGKWKRTLYIISPDQKSSFEAIFVKGETLDLNNLEQVERTFFLEDIQIQDHWFKIENQRALHKEDLALTFDAQTLYLRERVSYRPNPEDLNSWVKDSTDTDLNTEYARVSPSQSQLLIFDEELYFDAQRPEIPHVVMSLYEKVS